MSPPVAYGDADALIADYLEHDNMESLCSLVFDVYAPDLRKVIVSKLHPRNDSELDEYLTDFCDFLLMPTAEGRRRLDNFRPGQPLIVYIKSILRNWCSDKLAARSRKDSNEQSLDADDGPTIAIIADDEAVPYDEMTSALLKGIDGCGSLSQRDRYILLTWLMIKSSDPDATQVEVCSALAGQLGCSAASVRKALGRALVRLRDESLKNFCPSCPNGGCAAV